jgi:hypothetical protein
VGTAEGAAVRGASSAVIAAPIAPAFRGVRRRLGCRAAFLVLTLLSCRSARPPAPTVHTGPAGLSDIVDLPYGAGPVRWLVHLDAPEGCAWVPGPTDADLFGEVALDSPGWSTLEGRTGPSTARGEIRISEGVAEALFDATELAATPRDGDARVVAGPRIELNHVLKKAYRAEAVRWGEVLVLRLAIE